MENNKLLETILQTLDNKKAIDLDAIRIDDITVLTDYFVICTGTSTTHVKTLADEVEVKVKEALDIDPAHRDGYDGGKWVLLDYSDVMVHVFCEEYREFYKLERLWADGKQVDVSSYLKED